MELVSGHPRPSLVEALVYQCALRCPGRMASGAKRQPCMCACAGASPVVLSSFANVYVILVFYDMLEYSHPARRKALHCELIVVSNCLTPNFNCLLITSCSLTVRLLTFSASAVVLAGAICFVCSRALAFLSATSFAASFAAIVMASSAA